MWLKTLSKQHTANRWVALPSCYLSDLRQASSGVVDLMVGVMMTSKRAHAKGYLPGLLLSVPLWHISANPCPHIRPSNTMLRWVWFSLLWGHWSSLWVHTWKILVLASKEWDLCFCIKSQSHWPSRSDFLGIPFAYIGSPSWRAWHGAQDLHSSGYCVVLLLALLFSVFGLPTRWAWVLIYLLYPFYHFTLASSLSLDMSYLFLVVLLLIVVKLLEVGVV